MSDNRQAAEGIAQYFTYPSEARNGQRVTSTFGITYEFKVDKKTGRGGWFEAGASPTAAYIFNIGLTEAPPGTVNLDPAKPPPGEIGGINEPPDNQLYLRTWTGAVGQWIVATGLSPYIWGVALTENPAGTINVDPATNTIIGAIMEPPPDTFTYVRSYAGSVGKWVQTPPGTVYTFDTGLTLTGSSVTLDPALPPGGEIGGINEPPADTGFQYTRSYVAGVGIWTQTSGGQYTWGIGLVENPVGSFNIDLLPATAVELGGVTVQTRTNIQGLALAASGDLAAPLATDLLAGSIVEPAPDNLTYARKRDLAGVSSWVVTTAVFVGDLPPPAPLSQGQLWFESDTGRLHIYFIDANSAQWVQVGGA